MILFLLNMKYLATFVELNNACFMKDIPRFPAIEFYLIMMHLTLVQEFTSKIFVVPNTIICRYC